MAKKEDLQEDKYGSLREEFHQVILPLIRKCWHDKPTDVGMYCARYFQALVEERQRSCISGNENGNIQHGESAETGEKAEKCEPVPQAQESTSLPILTDAHRDRLPLRETSSWTSPSDSSSVARRLWDVADAMSRIGDQPDKNAAKEDALNAENCKAKGSDNQLFVGDEGSKDREIDLENNERNDDSSIFKPSKSSIIDEGIAAPVDIEAEKELSAIVNSASSSIDVTPATTYRKKWSSIIDSYLDLTLKSEFAEAIHDEEEFALDSNSKECSTKDDTAESPPNDPLGSDPQLESASSARTEQSSTPFIQKDIEDSVKLISQSLQDLVKVLDSMKLFCNEKLQRVKTLSEALPEKSLRAPRKKRSVTTFSSSDNLVQSEEFSRGPENKPTTTAANKGCSETSQKLLELKNNDSGVESDSFESGFPLRGKKVEEEVTKHKKTAAIEEINTGTSNNLGSNQGSFLDQNLEKNGRNINEDRVYSKDTYMNGKPRCKEGIVNKGFVIDDSELHRRNYRFGHHDQNWWHVNGYRRSMFNEQSPFSQIRIPRPSSGRNVNLTRHHNQTPRQMPLLRLSYIGEGGDMFSSSRRQCSVATETEATQATERVGTVDARIRAMRIHPVANGNTEQGARSLEQVNGKSGSQVSDRESQSLKSSLSDEQSSKLSEENPVETGSAAKGVPFSNLSEENPVETGSAAKGAPFSNLSEENPVETGSAAEGVPFSKLSEENPVETGSAAKGVPFSNLSEENPVETGSAAEGVPFSKLSEENPVETGSAAKGAPFSNLSEENPVETGSAAEGVPFSKLSEENPVETGSAVEDVPAGMDEKVESQESRIEIKSAKKSSSLNPCAESFNPPSKLVQKLEALKSSDENDNPNSEQGSFDLADVLSIKSFLEVDADFDYEMFLDDFLLDDQEPILYQNLDIVSLTMEEVEDQHKFENEVCAAEREVSVPYEGGRLMQGRDGTSTCEKKEDCKKQNCQSDMKLAEGDQGFEEGAERSDSAEKREEPGLSSACGDFVAVENNDEGGENSGDDAENVQVAAAPAAIAFDMGIPGFVPLNVNDNASQNRRQEEEMELNFACFSGSDSSEVDSSDISEEEGEFSVENEENKLEEKA